MTHTEQSSIRVIPVLDKQSNTPLLLHNFSTPKARPKSPSRDQHTQEQHRRTPRWMRLDLMRGRERGQPFGEEQLQSYVEGVPPPPLFIGGGGGKSSWRRGQP